MNFERNLAVSRAVFLAIEELRRPAIYSEIVHLARQYGSRHKVTADEVIEILNYWWNFAKDPADWEPTTKR